MRVNGVRIRHDGAESDIHAKAVVLACGGFEANPEWRTRYLGPGWDLAKVRGTASTPATASAWRLDIGAAPAATGRAATPWRGR